MKPSDLVGAGVLMAYYLVVIVALPTLIKAKTRVPLEVVRKIQHIAYSLSVFPMLRLFSTWYWSVAAAFLLVALAYPVLLIIERYPRARRLFVYRSSRGGELRKQLVYVQVSFAVLISLFWGVLGADWRYIVAVSVMAWGFGDAAAALVGKALGRRRVVHRLVEGPKTYAGTAAMMLAACAATFLTLILYAGKPWHVSLLVAVLVAPVCGIVELFSRRGTDTLTVPLSAAALILPVMYWLTQWGL